MLQLDYLLAAALLGSSLDMSSVTAQPRANVVVVRAVQELAICCEILDRRETRYILCRPDDFQADLQLLRQRWQELADAPRLQDGLRFPDRSTVSELLSFNRVYRQQLDGRRRLEPDHWCHLHEAVREADHLYQIWDTVRDARCEYYYVTVRRQALKRLRNMVGEEAYYAGCMPPHIPIWRFRPID